MLAFQAFTLEWAAECLRVLRPGGHLLSFASPRTYHHMAVGIEMAGFEIRDQIMWVFGSGFPKSHNLSGEFEGWEPHSSRGTNPSAWPASRWLARSRRTSWPTVPGH